MRRILLLCALLSSCELAKKEIAKIKIPDLAAIDVAALPLPKGVDGKPVLLELANARLELDPTIRDPITALGECVDRITYCYAPGERALDDCVRSVPTCATSTPWTESAACCPQQCQDDFAAARTAGAEPAGALDDVFFVKHTCFPGVITALEAP